MIEYLKGSTTLIICSLALVGLYFGVSGIKNNSNNQLSTNQADSNSVSIATSTDSATTTIISIIKPTKSTTTPKPKPVPKPVRIIDEEDD